MIATACSGEGCLAARDFKFKLDAVKLAYDPLTKLMPQVAQSDAYTFPWLAMSYIAQVEKKAGELYEWARAFVPKSTRDAVRMDKAAKLRIMPYMVAMMFAVRVQLDVYYIESAGVNNQERLKELQRSGDIVDQFTGTLETAVRVILYDSSLLEVALDYNLVLATCVTLKMALRAGIQTTLESEDASKMETMWDDGLSQIR